MSFTDEEIIEFKIEAEELLENAELSLLAVDRGADFSLQYDSVFRAFHSIKGAAGMMEMSALQEHMHRLETTLTEQKSGGTLKKPYVDWFLRGIDGCRSLLRDESLNFDYSVDQASTPKPVRAHKGEAVALKTPTPKVNSVKLEDQAKAETPVRKQPQSDRGRVLIVDDEPEIVDHFVSSLEEAGFEAKGTTQPLEVKGLIDSFNPDALISDISMPEMTGLELMALIRKSHLDLPIIFVSAYMDKKSLMEAVRLGIFGVIEKPFEMVRAIHLCSNAVRQSQVTRLLGTSLNLLLYQFSDLDGFLEKQGKHDIRNLIKNEMNMLLEQRRQLRTVKKASQD